VLTYARLINKKALDFIKAGLVRAAEIPAQGLSRALSFFYAKDA
jgi:hypothetical protein